MRTVFPGAFLVLVLAGIWMTFHRDELPAPRLGWQFTDFRAWSNPVAGKQDTAT
jgi:hypothetical protein